MPRLKDFVSFDAQTALTVFAQDFALALAAAPVDENWSIQYGLASSSRAIQTTYPLQLSAAGYKERTGDDKLRHLFERSLTMTTKQWVDGVEIEARKAEAPDFVGWGEEPGKIALEAARLPNTLIAAMLTANPLLDFYAYKLPGGSVASTIRLFADNHPVNIFDDAFGTFDNDHSASGINAAMLKAAKLRFRQKKGPNGKPAGLRLTTMLVPAAREEEARDFLDADNAAIVVMNQADTENVAAVASQNRHKGTVKLVVCDELESDDVIYLLDDRSTARPWIVQDSGAPEEIVYDKTSELYKNTGKIAVKYVLDMGISAALPHAIERVTLV